MPEAINLLVLGVGGNVSQGILKALADSSLDCRVIGGCIDARSAGLYVCDHAVVSPFATDPNFVDWLVETCRTHRVAGVLCGVESVLNTLAQFKLEIKERTDATLIVSSAETLAICGDKLSTAEWLRENALNYPQSVDAQDESGVRRLVKKCGYPLFAKPRRGKSSHGIMKIDSDSVLRAAMANTDYVIQEYLGNSSDEFTASTFTDGDGLVRGCIVFKRQLLGGTTVSAEVVDAPQVREQALAISEVLKPTGPCNMQFRLVDHRPVCFEINLRYSGTAPIRAHLGFNDVEAGVRHYILGEPAYDLPQIRRGVALRFWSEIYIDHRALDACSRAGELTDPDQAVMHLGSFGRAK